MKYIVVDFEMNPVSREYKEQKEICKNEVIEIGAILLDEDYTELDSFQMYVKPCFSQELRSYIVQLTGITDNTLRNAPCFAEAIKRFFEWCLQCGEDVQIIQWSENDFEQIAGEILQKQYKMSDQERHLMTGWQDFQKEYGDVIGMENKTSLSYAVMLAGAEFEGRRHDALFDARNTARIFRTVRIPEERKRSLGKVIEVLNTHTTLGSCLGEMFDFSKMIAVA